MPGTKAPEAERREQILAAAFSVAAREGLDGTTMLRIADVAGLSPGLLAFHFKSKRLLLRALLETVLAQVPAQVPAHETAAEAHSGNGGSLAQLVAAEIRRACADPWRARLLVDFGNAGVRDAEFGDRLREEYRRYRNGLRSRIETLRHVGGAGADGVWSHVGSDGITMVVLSLIHGCALHAAIDPDGFDVDSYVAASTAALHPSPTPAST